jgi:hypothetical protein
MRAQNKWLNFAMLCAAYTIVLPIAFATLPYPSLCAVVVMLSLTAIATYAMYLMLREIEQNYPDLYRDIGSPRLFAEQSFRDQLRVMGFILLRKYGLVSNVKVRQLGDIIFASSVLNFVIFIYMLLFRFNDFHGSTLVP